MNHIIKSSTENIQTIDINQCEFLTDEEIITDWLLSKSVGSRESYFGIIQQVYHHSNNLPLKHWTKGLILSFLYGLTYNYKVSTINKNLACIRSLLSHCVKENYLERNVGNNLTKFRENKIDKSAQSLQTTERIIGNQEVWNLINNGKTKRDLVLLKTIYLLGLRANEACQLHWDDISYHNNNYQLKIIGKANRIDFMVVHHELISEWEEINSSGYVFGISKPTIHRAVKYAVNKAQLNPKISTHWLRHQRASDLANSGQFTLFQVMEFMRHSSPEITAKYVHNDNKISSNAFIPS